MESKYFRILLSLDPSHAKVKAPCLASKLFQFYQLCLISKPSKFIYSLAS